MSPLQHHQSGEKRLRGIESYKMCYSFVRLKANESQPSVERESAKCRQSVDRLAVMLRKLLTDMSRWTLDRLSTAMSIDCGRSLDGVSIKMSIEMSIEGINRRSMVDAFSAHDPLFLYLYTHNSDININ